MSYREGFIGLAIRIEENGAVVRYAKVVGVKGGKDYRLGRELV
jgi:hypothetical protein